MNTSFVLFTTLYDLIMTPMMLAVDGMIGALTSNIGTILRAALILWVAWCFLWMAIDPQANPMSEMLKKSITCALVFTIATSFSAYHQVVANIFLGGISEGLSRLLSSSVGGTAVNAQAFNAVWNTAFASGISVMRGLSWDDWTMGLLVAFYFLGALGTITVAFAIWAASAVVIHLLVAVGPIFVALYPFNAVKHVFKGWLNSLLSAVIIQVLAVALLVIMIQAETTVLDRIASGTGNNVLSQVGILLGGLALFLLCAMVLQRIPSVATAIVSGVHMHVPQMGAAMMVVGGAAAGAASRAGAALYQAGMNPTGQPAAVTPPGRSISARRP